MHQCRCLTWVLHFLIPTIPCKENHAPAHSPPQPLHRAKWSVSTRTAVVWDHGLLAMCHQGMLCRCTGIQPITLSPSTERPRRKWVHWSTPHSITRSPPGHTPDLWWSRRSPLSTLLSASLSLRLKLYDNALQCFTIDTSSTNQTEYGSVQWLQVSVCACYDSLINL